MLILGNALVAVKRRAEHGEVRMMSRTRIVNIYILSVAVVHIMRVQSHQIILDLQKHSNL